jgi:hypothetical protein
VVRRTRVLPPGSALPLLLIVSTVLLVGACALSNDVRAAIGLSGSDSTPADDDTRAALRAPAMPDGPQAEGQPGSMTVTTQQRGYLDALGRAGVTPSSDLLALSIGSYVCQARAAKQNDQAMWDFVVPLVRSDLRSGRRDAEDAVPADLDTVTADYIRIATERLC